MVTVAGCAAPTDQPGVWALGHAGPRHESANAGITRDEQDVLAAATPGDQRYLLVGVAEFVDPEMSRAIGVRGRLLPVSRVNSTGVLAGGRRVAVKGVYIAGSPERINLTSVVDLGRACDAPTTQPAGRSTSDGVYTTAQDSRGAAVYNRECSTCHGERLKGGEGAPALTGDEFAGNWNGRTVADLFDRIRQTMPAPPEQPGKLSPQEYIDIVAHMLSVNNAPAGPAELPADVDGLRPIRIVFAPPAAVRIDVTLRPTFNRDVAPVLHARCVSCHRTGQPAPMPLLTYDDVRPWARAIKARVIGREMPPWFADPTFSARLANDPRLTEAEIETIAAWVDAGAPRGSGDAPPPPGFHDEWHAFKNRPPDAVLEMPVEFEVPAGGTLPVFTLWSPNPFTEDKFIEAVELRPGARAVVHHSDVTARALPPGTTLRRGRAWKDGPSVDFVPVFSDGRSYNELTASQDQMDVDPQGRGETLQNEAFRTSDDYRLLFYVPGGGFQQFPPGAVKRISAGNALAWNLHYTPTGHRQKDRQQLGLWFARTPPVHEVVTKRVGEAHIIEGREFVIGRDGGEFPTIPPFADDWRITAIMPLQEDATLYALWPHMHLRGRDMTFIATYPDGHEEVLLHVPNYRFEWQLQYELAEPRHLPAGTTIKTIGHYDNSPRNRLNPRPEAAVGWSEQTGDEMFNGWLELSYDRDVITRNVYSLAVPRHGRLSLAVGSGPAGAVYIRNADGSVAASGTIGASPAFVGPWTFSAGQTLETARSGTDNGTVTVKLFDVPPDASGALTVGGPPAAMRIEQPGQNGAFAFEATAAQQVEIAASENTIGGVTISVATADRRTVLASMTSSSRQFTLSPVTLPSPGSYAVIVDPAAANVGTVAIGVR